MREININKSLIDRYNNERLKPKENTIPEINIDENLIESYNKNGNVQVGSNPSLEKAEIENRIPSFNPTLKRIDDLTFSQGANEDEREYLKAMVNSGRFTTQEIEESIQTVMGEHPRQKFTIAGIESSAQTWYRDPKTGKPIPLAPGEKAPKGLGMESVWGLQESAEDDSSITGFIKNVANAVPSFIGAFEDVGALIQTTITGSEEDPGWYKAGKQRLEALKGKTSTASQEAMLDVEKVKEWQDIFKGENWTFTPQNVMGTIGQATGTIMEFIAANALTGGLAIAPYAAEAGLAVEEASALFKAGKISKEAYDKAVKAKRLIKGAATTAQMAASIPINMGELVDMADEAGLKGENKFQFAFLGAVPMALIETNLGIGAKVLGNGAYQDGKRKVVSEAVKKLSLDETGKLTAEGLSSAMKEIEGLTYSLAKKYAAEPAMAALGEATEEVSQAMVKNASAQIYDSFVKDGTFDKKVWSPEAAAEYLNNAIAGALTGGGMHAKTRKNEIQSLTAYQAVKEDGGVAQRAQLESARKAEMITQEEYDLGIQKINTFKEYSDQIAKSGIKLSKEDERKVFDLTWSAENLKAQIKKIGENPTGVDASLLASTQKNLTATNAEIAAILDPAVAKEQTKPAEAIIQKSVKDKAAPKVAKEPEEPIIKIKEQPQSAKDKMAALAANLAKKSVETEVNPVDETKKLAEQIRAAKTEKDIDAFINEADKKGLTFTPNEMDEFIQKKEKFSKITMLEKEKEQKIEDVINDENEVDGTQRIKDIEQEYNERINKLKGISQSNKETVTAVEKEEKITPEITSQSNEKTTVVSESVTAEKEKETEPVKSETKVEEDSEAQPTETPSVETKDRVLKAEYVGKVGYSTPGSGKSTLAKSNKNIIDGDDLLVDAIKMLNKKEKFTTAKITSDNVGSIIYEAAQKVMGKDRMDKFYNYVLDQAKERATKEGKTVLFGSHRMVGTKEMRDKLDFILTSKTDEGMKAKKITTGSIANIRGSEKKAEKKTELEGYIGEVLTEPTKKEQPKAEVKKEAKKTPVKKETTKSKLEKLKETAAELKKKAKEKVEKEKKEGNPLGMNRLFTEGEIELAFATLLEKIADSLITIDNAIKELRTYLKKSSITPAEQLAMEIRLENLADETLEAIDEIMTNNAMSNEEKEEQITQLHNNLVDHAKLTIGDDRFRELVNKVRKIYTGVKGFKNDAEIEKMLVDISHRPEPFDKDFASSIEKLYAEGREEDSDKKMNLAKHLKRQKKSDLIRLFNVFRSTEYNAYIKIHNQDSKQPFYTAANSMYEADMIEQVTNHLAEIREREYSLAQGQLESKNAYTHSPEKETALLAHLRKFTGLGNQYWERYLTAPTLKSRENAYKRLYNQTIKGAKDFGLPEPTTKEQFLYNLGASQTGKGGPINTIVINTPFADAVKANIATKFKNVKWDSKASGDFLMHLTNSLNRIMNDDYNDGGEYATNDWVQDQRKKGKVAGIFIDGIFRSKEKSASAGDMTADDVRKTLVTNYLSKELGNDEYLQNVGQFGDKDKMVFVPARRYASLKEAQDKVEKQLAQDGYTTEEIKQKVGIILDDANLYRKHFMSTKLEDAELFTMTYAANFHDINEFVNGEQKQYIKKGKDAYIDLFKRNGSTASPGIVLNKWVEGGVGESHRLVVINKPTIVDEVEKDFALVDGQEFISRKYSDQIKVSSGGMFDTIIKAVTSYTQPNKQRVLIKTNAIVIDDLVKAFPENKAYKAIKDLMDKNNVQRVVTKDGAKYHGDAKVLNIFADKSYDVVEHTLNESNVLTIKTDDYLIQQDLVHDGTLNQGSTPIQRIKNMLKAKSALETTQMYNRLGVDQVDALREEMNALNPKDFRDYLLKKLKYTDEEIDDLVDALAEEEGLELGDVEYIDKLLANKDVSFSHPHLNKWLNTFIANIITKEALGRITNKGLFVEMGHLPSKDFELKEMRVVGDKVLLPEIAISETSKLRGPSEAYKTMAEAKLKAMAFEDMLDADGKVREHEIEKTKDGYVIPGEYVMVTRIPADDMHSHTLARVKYKLPPAMKNVIITNYKVQRAAGSDFDGDQRTVEGLFKNRDGKVIKGNSPQGMANQAFKKDIEWFYDKANFANATKPIDTEFLDDNVLKHLPKGKPMENNSPETFVQSRLNNNVGLAVVGNMANLQAVYDYLKKHKSFLKKEMMFPKLKLQDGNIISAGNIQLKEFKISDDIKERIGNLLNMSLDNVKDPKIEKLGLNEVTANMYVMALSLGADIESVAAFFNSPVVKDYIERVRATKATNAKNTEFDVIREMIKAYAPNYKGEKIMNALPKIDAISEGEVSKEKSLEVLSFLNTLQKASKDFNKIHNVIKSNENAKKTWSDYQYGSQVFEDIKANRLKSIDTETFKDSPYFRLAEKSLEVSKEYLDKFSPEQTVLGREVYDEIYNNVVPQYKRGFSKKQLEAISKGLHSILLNNSRGRTDDFRVWGQKFVARVNELKKLGKYPDILNALEIIEDKVYDRVWNEDKKEFEDKSTQDVMKIALRPDFRQAMPQEEIEKFSKAMVALEKTPEGKELSKWLVDYAAFQYGLAVSKFGGSYASLFPMSVHEQIGTAMNSETIKWNDEEYVKNNVGAVISSIAENNPSVNPEFNGDFTKQNGSVKGRPVYQPIVKKTIDIDVATTAIEALKSGVKNSFSINQNAQSKNAANIKKIEAGKLLLLKSGKESVIRTVKSTGKDVNGNFLVNLEPITQPQQQKVSTEPNEAKLLKVVEKVQKAFPKVKVVYDNTIMGAGQLSEDGKVVSINPGYAGIDTPIHEFGHVLIDAIGGLSNPVIRKGIEQLKESDLWKETAKKYPELSEDMLAKEVLAEAIGREGKNLFKEKEKQNKFISWLSALFFKLKSKLGLEKNVAKKLAAELLSGKDLGLATVASGAVQQQKEAEEEQEEEEPKEKTKEERVKEIIDALRSQMITNWRTYAQRIEKTRGGEYKAEAITKKVRELKHKIETTTGQEQADAQLEYDYYTSNDDNYKKEFEQYQKEFEDVLKHYARMDFDLAPLEKMYEYYSTLKRYNVLATENIISELLDAMAARIGERGVEAIKAKNPQYNEALTSKEDIKMLDVIFKALSDMDERYPEMQELAREFNKAYTDSLEERQRFVQEVLDVEKKIIEDYNKLHGITGKIKDFLNPFEDNSKYYTFLLNDKGAVIKKGDADFKSLTENQQKFVTLYNQVKSNYKDLSGKSIFGNDGLIKVERTFSEFYRKNDLGMLEAYMHYSGQGTVAEDRAILKYEEDGKAKFLQFADIKNRIKAKADKNIFSKVEAIYQIAKYKKRAAKAVEKGMHEAVTSDGKPMRFEAESLGGYSVKDGKIQSKFNSAFRKGKSFSGDHGRALREYITDMAFIKNMSRVVPIVDALEQMNKHAGAERKYMVKYLEFWKKGNILKEVQPSLGDGWDQALGFVRAWTQLKIMAFNVPASVMNVFIGKYSQFRGEDWEYMKEGRNRYWKDFKKTKNMATHFHISSAQEDDKPTYNIKNFFSDLAFGLTKMGEHYIQVPAVIGYLSDEQWSWINEDGLVTDSNGYTGKDEDKARAKAEGKKINYPEISRRTTELKAVVAAGKKKVANIQGKYSDNEKRNFAHFEAGRAGMQFKVWMPDAWRDRFAGTYIDINGDKRQGTLNFLMKQGLKELARKMSSPAEWEKIVNSNEHEYKMMRRNIKSLISIMGMYLLVLAASDDDDDKFMAQQLNRAMQGMMFAFDFDTAEFVFKSPVASLSTMSESVQTFRAIMTLEEYKRNTPSHKKGDFKFTEKAENLLPYNKLIDAAENVADFGEE